MRIFSEINEKNFMIIFDQLKMIVFDQLKMIAEGNITFCGKKYRFFNYLIRCSSHLAIPDSKLINRILTDMKEICKKRSQIDLD